MFFFIYVNRLYIKYINTFLLQTVAPLINLTKKHIGKSGPIEQLRESNDYFHVPEKYLVLRESINFVLRDRTNVLIMS